MNNLTLRTISANFLSEVMIHTDWPKGPAAMALGFSLVISCFIFLSSLSPCHVTFYTSCLCLFPASPSPVFHYLISLCVLVPHFTYLELCKKKQTTLSVLKHLLQDTHWPNRTTRLHTVVPCLFLADPATFLSSNSVLGSYFPLRKACSFSYGKINISGFVLFLYWFCKR